MRDIMNNRELRFRTLLSLTFVVFLSAFIAAQSVEAPAKESSPDSKFERRLAQILPRGAHAATAATHTQSPSRNSVRLPDASVAAERYVFGRMDLATDPTPNVVAIGAFQTGGPQSIATANYGEASVSVLLANPDGTFQPSVDYAVGSGPDGIVVGDFNRDGWQLPTTTPGPSPSCSVTAMARSSRK
jgi:hypothetical protein